MSEAYSLARRLYEKMHAGMPPNGSFVAPTILWNTFAFNEDLKGVTADELRYAVLGPGLDAAFVKARERSSSPSRHSST